MRAYALPTHFESEILRRLSGHDRMSPGGVVRFPSVCIEQDVPLHLAMSLQRRQTLVDRKIRGTLTKAELLELNRIDLEVDAFTITLEGRKSVEAMHSEAQRRAELADLADFAKQLRGKLKT
jgi:hypothetical protein